MKGDRIVPNIFAVDCSELRFPVLTVYASPRDYPGKYVVRLWDTDRPTNIVMVYDTLEIARAAIPESMIPIARADQDDPCIVEVYI